MKNLYKALFIVLIFACTLTIACNYNNITNLYAEEEQNEYCGIESYIGYGCGGCTHKATNEQDDLACYKIEDYTALGCTKTHNILGRAAGYSVEYLNGCRNWQLMPLYSPFYNYYIDESSLSGLTETQKTTFINNVHTAAETWNSVVMHDGSTRITLQEVMPSVGCEGGTNTCPIKYNSTLGDLGYFNPIPGFYYIELQDYTVETILHEMGHLLDLQDLDRNNAGHYSHDVLMGYYRNHSDLHYQDIQGAILARGGHTTHDFSKFVYDGGKYKHICFYCDVMNIENAPLTGSSHLTLSENCSHDYKPMVSQGDRHWHKCTKCYKVIETAFEDPDNPHDGVLNYKRNADGTFTVKSLRDTNATNIVIPETFWDNTVSAIGDFAFRWQELDYLYIPASIKTIGESAFEETDMTVIDFAVNSQLESIGARAFYKNYGTEFLILPDSVKTIGESAFEEAVFLDLSLFSTSRLESIGAKAFYRSGITSFRVPDYLTEIGERAFACTENLTNFTFSNGSQLEKINSKMFYMSKIQNITLPPSVKSIEENAFAATKNLKSVTFSGNGLETIGTQAFYGTGLTEITLPEGVNIIYNGAFSQSLIKTITIPDSVTMLSTEMFLDTPDLRNVNFGENSRLLMIENRAFFNSGIRQITLPSTICGIFGTAFASCKYLTDINIAEENNSYYSADGVLYRKSDSKLVCYPAGRTANSPEINSDTIEIGDYALAYNGYLTQCVLPESVDYISEYTFYYSENLSDLYISNTEKVLQFGDNCFYGVAEDFSVHVPSAFLPEYRSKYPDYNFVSL